MDVVIEQLQSISDVILTFFIHLMPTCYSIFWMKQKSGKANLIYSENAKANKDIFLNRKIQKKATRYTFDVTVLLYFYLT